MLTLILWWTGILVESMILVRSVQLRTLPRFPFFFFYITSVLCADILLYVVRITNPSAYLGWTARAEVLNIVLGYGIILEIFKHVLSRYPGIDRMSQIVGLAIFVLVLGFTIMHPAGPIRFTDASTHKVVLERNFLAVQMIFFLAAIAIVSYYDLEVTPNIRGMILGYGIWLGATVITLELRAYFGPVLNTPRHYLLPLFYLVSLLEWLRSMWTYSPASSRASSERIPGDHGLLAAKTTGIADELRAHIGRVARP